MARHARSSSSSLPGLDRTRARALLAGAAGSLLTGSAHTAARHDAPSRGEAPWAARGRRARLAVLGCCSAGADGARLARAARPARAAGGKLVIVRVTRAACRRDRQRLARLAHAVAGKTSIVVTAGPRHEGRIARRAHRRFRRLAGPQAPFLGSDA